jgi:hypothetical protein
VDPTLVLVPRDSCAPLNEGDELLFCRTCNARAVHFLKASQYAVLMAGADSSQSLKERVLGTLATFLDAHEACPACSDR